MNESIIEESLTSQDLLDVVQQRLVSQDTNDTVVSNRAVSAGIVARVGTLKEFDVAKWQEAVTAMYAVSYGSVGESVTNLIEICFHAKTRTAAGAACSAFAAAEPTLGFVDQLVSGYIPDVLFSWTAPREQTLKKIAEICGLVAEAGMYESKKTPLSPAGPRRVGSKVDLEAALTRGVANFDVASLPMLLEYWRGLAHRTVEPISLPESLSWDSIKTWVSSVLDASMEDEGPMAPCAFIDEVDGNLHIGWWGTFTQGRHFRLSIFFGKEGDIVTTIRWNSATGAPSTFLKIQDLLVLPGCIGFCPAPEE